MPMPEQVIAQRDFYFKNRARLLVTTTRDRLWVEGGFKVGNYWFPSDLISRTQYLGLLQFGNNMPSGLTWKTMDGTIVELTPVLVQQILQSAALSDKELFDFAESLLTQIENTQIVTHADMPNVDISIWPVRFVPK